MLSSEEKQIVRMRFPLVGRGFIPVDHGEALYGAISNTMPELHGREHIGISPVEGGYADGNLLHLDNKGYFFIQLPVSLIPLALQLAGKRLLIQGHMFRAGVPNLSLIKDTSELYARMVTVKGKTEEAEIQEYILRMIQVGTQIDLDATHIKVLRRRIVSIHDKKIVTFGVRLTRLPKETSYWVQAQAPWGRKRYGCSFYVNHGGEEVGGKV
ncbi:MAG: type I-MYXAN CRISPR-associated protein Cas6/Cmx6 [Desulfitobacteriaceae bacterium]